MSDDITFCMSECDNKECFRHPTNIVDKTNPHSYADLKDTELCTLNKRKMTRKEAIANLKKARCVPYKKETLAMAIEALEEVEKHEETFDWCTDCKEYDQDNHCCHRWTKHIRNTAEELNLERKRGKWMQKEIYQPWGDAKIKVTMFECSLCGYTEDGESKFCANCGADMRGSENDGE